MTLDQKIQLGSLIVSLLGFGIIIVQFYIGIRIIKADKISKIYSELHEIHHVFVEHPLLRPYFFNKVQLSAPEQHDIISDGAVTYYRAMAIAEMFFDIFEHIYFLRKEATSEFLSNVVTSAGDVGDNWDSYIDAMIRDSSFLAGYLVEVSALTHPIELRKRILNSIQQHWPNLYPNNQPSKAS